MAELEKTEHIRTNSDSGIAPHSCHPNTHKFGFGARGEVCNTYVENMFRTTPPHADMHANYVCLVVEPDRGKLAPSSTKSGQIRRNVGQLWPGSAELVPRFANFGLLFAQCGFEWPTLVELGLKLANAKSSSGPSGPVSL